MKQIIFTFISLCLLTPANAKSDAVHCLGNGQMLVYERQSDILQLIGNPYSTPSTFSLQLPGGYEVVSEREKGGAIWTHRISKDGVAVAEITDFVVSGMPCFVRKINAFQAFHYRSVLLTEDVTDIRAEYAIGLQSALLMKTPRGTPFYNDYPLINNLYNRFLTIGSLSLHGDKLLVERGEGVLYVTGGLYPDCSETATAVLNAPYNDLLQQTRLYWADFTARRRDFGSLIPQNAPQRDKLLQTIDDVSVMLKCQQANEGAVIAGYNYHLGYVRDQYGVSRGLLALGYADEARQILDFYYRIWCKEGKIQNAQGVGNFAFHVHENDNVEITGYLLVQAFDYLQSTGDNDFILRIFDMLKWAYNVQATQLLKGMLPFNGDETFVAGGLLPRTTLMDGSAEATLLFINGGEALLKWTAQNKPKEQLDATVLQAVKKSFADNFIINNRLATNNPARMNGETYPAFRHGICENLGNTEGCEFFGWTQCTANNRYLCPHCFATVNLPKATPETYFLPSVTLMPFYTRDEFVDRKVLLFQLQELADYYRANNVLPSKLAHTETNKITGYDYGFFLYALTQTGNPLASQVYNDMLAALDNTGAWVEYYENGVPCGTLCRPWESAINLEAAINYVITKN